MSKKLTLSVAVISLLALAGCGDKGEQEEQGPVAKVTPKNDVSTAPAGDVLLRIDGRPVVTVAEFESYRDKVLDIQPQYKQMMAMMPESERIKIDQNLYENLVNQKILQAWIEKNNIDDTPEYKKDLDLIVDFAKQNLSVKHFQEHHPVSVTEADIKKYYEDNKDKMPGLMQTPGGVNALAAKFDDKEKAQAFLAQVNAGADFAKAAKAEGVDVEEFEHINSKSFNLDMQVRKALLAAKTFPKTELVSAGKAHWVVKATGKDKPVYVAFDQVKDGLENMLKQQKQTEVIQAELEKLKGQYDINSNESYFNEKLKVAEAKAKEAAERVAAAEQANDEAVRIAKNNAASQPKQSAQAPVESAAKAL